MRVVIRYGVACIGVRKSMKGKREKIKSGESGKSIFY